MPAPWDADALDAAAAVTSLRHRIRANAAFSGVSGLAVVVLAPWLADQLGTDRHGLVRLVGVALAAYAIDQLVVASARWSRLRVLARGVVLADVLWVAGTAVALAGGWIEHPTGIALVALTGAAVGAFARVQHVALIRAGRLAHGPGETAELVPTVDGSGWSSGHEPGAASPVRR